MYIALSGFAGVGKDEAAKTLVEEFGFQRIAFADPIRETLYALNPIIGTRYPSGEFVRLQYIINRDGWDIAKRMYDEIRTLVQRLGTEVGREMFGQNFWIDTAMRKASQFENVVFTDCRFENEAEAVRNAGGIIVRITRPGVAPVNGHVSDKGLPDALVDYTIANDGTVLDLKNAVRRLVNRQGVAA